MKGVIELFVAMNERRELINIVHYRERTSLLPLKEQHLYCPQCERPVILKIGTVMIPHFAHVKHSNCSESFAEGETLEHMQAKIQLYSLFERSPYTPQLEPVLRDCAQRPDLYVKDAEQHYVIEYQWTPISKKQLQKRTTNYIKANYPSFWLTKPPHSLRPNLIQIVRLTPFYRAVYESNERPYLYYYDPRIQSFYYIAPLIHIQNDRYIGHVQKIPYKDQTVPFRRDKPELSSAQIERYIHYYAHARMRRIEQAIRYERGNDTLLTRCHDLKLLPFELPNWIGVPLIDGHVFRQHALDWQFHYVHHCLMAEEDWSSEDTVVTYSAHYGLSEAEHHIVEQYRQFLVQVRVNDLRDILSEATYFRHFEMTLVAKGQVN